MIKKNKNQNQSIIKPELHRIIQEKKGKKSIRFESKFLKYFSTQIRLIRKGELIFEPLDTF